MYIPNTMPLTLAEMLDFLQPTVEDGLFDSVAYDDADSPTKIVCTQNGNTILDISSANNGHGWYFVPYISAGTAATGFGVNVLAYTARCKGGVYFRSTNTGGPNYYFTFIIAKTGSGKTGFIQFNSQMIAVGASLAPVLYSRCFGDDTSLSLYTYGYLVACNYTSATVADRTILTKLPVVGARGSTDAFSSVFVRSLFQFVNDGQQSIGGKTYGCIDMFAILDE
ncbi:MAG: hypothetical protein IJ060_09340 [Oscillospiraceae bacterium]|nr:hypothetical protein [Oscillospiraceae bacterium]